MIVKAPKKMLRIVFSVVMATILALITIMVVNVIAHKDYISVEAEVSEVYTDTFQVKAVKAIHLRNMQLLNILLRQRNIVLNTD